MGDGDGVAPVGLLTAGDQVSQARERQQSVDGVTPRPPGAGGAGTVGLLADALAGVPAAIGPVDDALASEDRLPRPRRRPLSRP